MTKYNFDVLVKDSEGNPKPGEPVSKFLARAFEGFGEYEQGDRNMIWTLVGEIGRKGEVELNEREIELLKKYWRRISEMEQYHLRLDVDFTVRSILDMGENNELS